MEISEAAPVKTKKKKDQKVDPANTPESRRARFMLTSWKPGQSGNPNGRPKIVKNIRDLCREHTVTAVQALIEVASDRGHPQRVHAANSLLDRGYGRPIQQLEIGEAGAFSEMNEVELLAFITNARKELKVLETIDVVASHAGEEK